MVNNAVKVEVQDRIAFRCDSHLLVLAILRQTEACEMTFTIACDKNIIFVLIFNGCVRNN